MAVSSRGLIASRPLGLRPLQGFSVKNSQIAVVLFAVVAPEHVQLLVVKRGCMILNLRRRIALSAAVTGPAIILALLVTMRVLRPREVLPGLPTAPSIVSTLHHVILIRCLLLRLLAALGGQDPLQLERVFLGFPGRRGVEGSGSEK